MDIAAAAAVAKARPRDAYLINLTIHPRCAAFCRRSSRRCAILLTETENLR